MVATSADHRQRVVKHSWLLVDDEYRRDLPTALMPRKCVSRIRNWVAKGVLVLSTAARVTVVVCAASV